MHCAEGKLLLSSYRNDHIRSAVHRLNAEEPDPSMHVRVAEVVDELAALRDKGWLIEHRDDGIGCVAVMLPRCRHMDRLVISVLGPSEHIAERGEDILGLLMERKEQIAAAYVQEKDVGPEPSNVIPMPPPMKIQSYHRYYA